MKYSQKLKAKAAFPISTLAYYHIIKLAVYVIYTTNSIYHYLGCGHLVF